MRFPPKRVTRMRSEPLIFVLMISNVNGKHILIYNKSPCVRSLPSKDPLSPLHSLHHFSHKRTRPWCRTFGRPLLLNHQADWPPDTTAAVIALRAITAAPSPEESDVFVLSSHHGGPKRVATASGSSLHPQHRLPLLLFLPHKPRAQFCRAFALDLVSWFPRLHCRGPTPPMRPFGNSLHLLWRLQSPPCRPINWHKHTTINGALVC